MTTPTPHDGAAGEQKHLTSEGLRDHLQDMLSKSPDPSGAPTSERVPNIHQLKTWPQYFEQVRLGNKTFEARKDDRDFEVGDDLRLVEWCPESKEFTGRKLDRVITYVLRNTEHVSPGFCILGMQERATTIVAPSSRVAAETGNDGFTCTCLSITPGYEGVPCRACLQRELTQAKSEVERLGHLCDAQANLLNNINDTLRARGFPGAFNTDVRLIECIQSLESALTEARAKLVEVEAQRDIAKRRGEELERHIDQVGFFFAGSDHQNIADQAIEILKGNGEVEGWLRQQRSQLAALQSRLSEVEKERDAARKYLSQSNDNEERLIMDRDAAEKQRDLHKEHEMLNCMQAVWFEEALGFKDMPLGVDAHELAKEKLRDMIAREGALTTALAAAEKALDHWQHVWKETDCEHDDCMSASDEADKALDLIRAQQPQGGGKEA